MMLTSDRRCLESHGRVPNNRVCKLIGHQPWSCHTYPMELGYDNWYDNSTAGGSSKRKHPETKHCLARGHVLYEFVAVPLSLL